MVASPRFSPSASSPIPTSRDYAGRCSSVCTGDLIVVVYKAVCTFPPCSHHYAKIALWSPLPVLSHSRLAPSLVSASRLSVLVLPDVSDASKCFLFFFFSPYFLRQGRSACFLPRVGPPSLPVRSRSLQIGLIFFCSFFLSPIALPPSLTLSGRFRNGVARVFSVVP